MAKTLADLRHTDTHALVRLLAGRTHQQRERAARISVEDFVREGKRLGLHLRKGNSSTAASVVGCPSDVAIVPRPGS